MSEVARVLKPGGHLLMSVPFLFQAHGGVDECDDFTRWTKTGLIRLVTEHSLDVVEVHSFGGVGTTFAQLFNSYLIRKCKVYDSRRFILKCCVLLGFSPLFVLANIAGLCLNRLDRDTAYACGFHIVARKDIQAV